MKTKIKLTPNQRKLLEEIRDRGACTPSVTKLLRFWWVGPSSSISLKGWRHGVSVSSLVRKGLVQMGGGIDRYLCQPVLLTQKAIDLLDGGPK